ncbi:MAG: GMC family oxidoreductase [Reichenbachiella sp.]|uniref:GMC family oxidoreductase n=1 Tax=Reichenbachiella sp. TaxID=2184521 RepID=UPI0032660A4C
MANLNSKSSNEYIYDAIVVGSGISGGWAAKELCQAGLKTVVLERGRDVKHIQDYPTMNMDPWDMKYKGELPREEKKKYYKQARTGYTAREEHAHFFVKDTEHEYNETQPFDWMRGYQVGGRSLVWGRQSYRLSPMDFEANKKDGYGVDWPIRYKDLAPWYDYVESFIGVSGSMEGIPHLPDGKFMPPFELNCGEIDVKSKLESSFPERHLIIGRTAHVTGPKEGRNQCMARSRCSRGCPYGGYFSSQSSTLPAAEATGNLTLRPDSIVAEILYDADTQRATGVKVIDKVTHEETIYKAKIIFLNASAIASAALLMNSKSDRFPDGMGNDSGELGHNIMDHLMGGGAGGNIEGLDDKYYSGRRPTGFYIPRFVNLDKQSEKDSFIRGYGYQGGASRVNWGRGAGDFDYGAEFKNEMLKPGPWWIGMGGFGECLPYHENFMTLNYEKKDQWGLPTVTFDAAFRENEKNMVKDIGDSAAEMLEAAGVKNVQSSANITNIGLGIHEMGTARMGKDPKTSILNEWNQLHAVSNVFVTDGACMTSSACQNPSLTYMALTARAANKAVELLKTNAL